MTTFLLIVHGLFAVALLGSITHQAISVLVPARKTADSFVGRVRAESAPSYVSAIIVLYVATAILGGIIYGEYRMAVRVVLEQLDLWKANGAFELKEHFVALGLGMLPRLLVLLAPTAGRKRDPRPRRHHRNLCVYRVVELFGRTYS